MASTVTQLINCNFGGIRRKDSVFLPEKITCSDCQNVELYFTQLNSGIGIRTTKGNKSITDLIPNNEEVIGIFESHQANNTYFLVYTESETEGKLYNLDLAQDTLTELVDELSVTGNACGVDFEQGWLDMFVFSNGEDIKYIYSDREHFTNLVVEESSNLTLQDQDGRTVKGLGLANFDNRLWIFNGNVLWYSEQGECRDFQYNSTDAVTSAGYMEFVKPITAIYPYLGSLAVFHKDSSVLVNVDATTGFARTDESPGGCASYNSLVFHGTDLFFYDDTKKGVFSFQQVINGDKTLGDNIAYDIQDELLAIGKSKLNKIRTLSVVTEDRNEVWFLIPLDETYNVTEIDNETDETITVQKDASIVMIFDYIRGEWVKRKCQHLNTLNVIDGVFYSAGKSIYQEYVSDTFNGDYIEHFYKCTMFNFGADNTLKITKFPPRATLDGSYTNHFHVKYVKNYNILKAPKIKEIKAKGLGGYLIYDNNQHYDSGIHYKTTSTNVIIKLPSATFKTLEITFFTTKAKENFCFKTLEMSKVKIKQV